MPPEIVQAAFACCSRISLIAKASFCSWVSRELRKVRSVIVSSCVKRGPRFCGGTHTRERRAGVALSFIGVNLTDTQYDVNNFLDNFSIWQKVQCVKFQLAHEIEALKADRGLNQTQLASASAIDSATLSRVRAGVRQMTFEDVALLRAAFNGVGVWPARLLRARLLDECYGPGAERIAITLDGKSNPAALRETSPVYSSPKLEKAMRKIHAHVGSDSKLRDVILFLADHLPEP